MIYGERIRFRAAGRADLPRFTDWLNDPEVRAGIAQSLPFSVELEEQWFEKMLQRPHEEQVLVIEARQPDESWLTIGNCGLFGLDWRSRCCELGILIGAKSCWNQGYGAESVRLLLKHGFETLNLNRIYLRVFETNPRAIRAYEKVGFKLEGRQREAEYRDGKYIDVLMMSVLRSEWQG